LTESVTARLTEFVNCRELCPHHQASRSGFIGRGSENAPSFFEIQHLEVMAQGL
jgi:hypothetical protein